MPVVVPAVPALLTLAILIVAIALVAGTKVFVSALFLLPNATLGWVPWLGGKLKASSMAIEKKINHELSATVDGLGGAIGSTWHVLAYLIEQTGEAIWDATRVAARALYLAEVTLPLALARAAGHAIPTKITNLTKTTTTITKRITVVRGVTAAQLSRLGRRVHGLEARLAATAIAGAGAIALPFPRIGALERAGRNTKARLGKLERRFGRTAFAAAVATALATLGVGWARKSCAKRTAEGFCRVDPDVFGALIGGLAVVVGAQSVVRFGEAMIAVEDEFVSVLERMIVELGDVAN